MRYILGGNRESRILEMLDKLNWLCMALYIKYRVFIFIYKVKKGLFRGIDEDVVKLIKGENVKGTRGGDSKWTFSEFPELDKMIWYKGVREYNKFKCPRLEEQNIDGFKMKLFVSLKAYQRENWGDGRLLPLCYRD